AGTRIDMCAWATRMTGGTGRDTAPPPVARSRTTGLAQGSRSERRIAAVLVLAIQRGLSRAHRAQPQGAVLRDGAGAPAARRRRTAHPRIRRHQPATPGSGAAAWPAPVPAVAGDPGIHRRGLADATAVAGHLARAPARALAGPAGRGRRAPAQQPAGDALPGARVERAPGRARRLDPALDQRRVRRL